MLLEKMNSGYNEGRKILGNLEVFRLQEETATYIANMTMKMAIQG